MEAKEAATGIGSRTQRADYQATADPALNEAADRTADIKLLGYGELYDLWERQQWQTQELDFSQDREDWHERISAEERFQRMYGLSSFFIGEQKVAEELGPIMRAAPTEDQKVFLCTQIADEARHVRFFERFYREVGVLESDGLSRDAGRDLRAPERQLRPALRRDARGADRAALARTRGHRGAGRGGDALPHGHRGDAGPHRAALHHGVQRTRKHAAGVRRGLRQRRPRRASPRRLRLGLPAREGGRGRPLQGGDPAHAGGVAAGRRRGLLTAVGGGRRRLRAVRLLARRKPASSPAPA